MMHRDVRNGYQYQVDDQGRTRNISGAPLLVGKPVRSRAEQAQPGGVERQPSVDGGHDIAVRFSG
ncbi:DNA/RNA non-specific endonuclease [Sphingomonas sp. TREG-RG-20F-R18-01]|uniref:DNA/RNA non-specific endonuclease n=1 Tax=Sphingomonas sp. TREG-RG-20F-R18-01 TaxID=2914982 RepID=UPI001F5A651E|nr:DNA/RNA non-specific endonuclease [Sphingomonas sp. TREG-RG-20F-R18-01]